MKWKITVIVLGRKWPTERRNSRVCSFFAIGYVSASQGPNTITSLALNSTFCSFPEKSKLCEKLHKWFRLGNLCLWMLCSVKRRKKKKKRKLFVSCLPGGQATSSPVIWSAVPLLTLLFTTWNDDTESSTNTFQFPHSKCDEQNKNYSKWERRKWMWWRERVFVCLFVCVCDSVCVVVVCTWSSPKHVPS